MLTVRATAGVVPFCWRAARRRRAATTRLTPSLIAVPKMAWPTGVVVLCSKDFPARSSGVSSEQVVQIGATRSGWSEAQTQAFHLAEFFAVAPPNV